MAKKFYVVWQGRETGIFTDWDSCKRQVYGVTGARYKSFPTRELAAAAFQAGGSSTPVKGPTRTRPGKLKTWTSAEIKALDVDCQLFTDGGCEPNPGESGTGIALYRSGAVSELWYGLYEPHGTNNTAELHGLDQALRMAATLLQGGQTVAIFSDSSYAISCLTQWAGGWAAKGWVRKGGEIKNLDLIKPMYERYLALQDRLEIYHVNGHVGVEGNELADRMSILAIQSREPNFVRYDKTIDVPTILARRSG